MKYFRISPERLCLELCISQSDVTIAEQLGISLSLDLNSLFEVAADYLLSCGSSKQANRLFQTAKVGIIMPPTSKKFTGHIGFGLFVRALVHPSVRQEPCMLGF